MGCAVERRRWRFEGRGEETHDHGCNWERIGGGQAEIVVVAVVALSGTYIHASIQKYVHTCVYSYVCKYISVHQFMKVRVYVYNASSVGVN